MIQRKYKFYFNNPKVSVKLTQKSSFVVYVTGAVLSPGSYEIDTDDNIFRSTSKEVIITRRKPLLTNVLVAAGGLSFDADLENIEIKNSYNSNRFIKINLLDFLENNNQEQDVYLIPGDSVIIPRMATPFAVSEEKFLKYASASFSPKEVPVKVYGFVNKPGLVYLESARSLNLNSAITSAGGYLLDSAYAPKKVYISRADKSGKLVTKAIDPRENDVVLLPNDIVYVPEKTRPLVGKFFDYMFRIAAPFEALSNGYDRW